MAHFMEHLTFKGTASWPSTRAVSEAIEGIGGTSNAATDRESTTYWARVPSRDAGLAMRMLGELVTRPLLREEDVAHERTVVIEEIRSYRDDPGEYVFNLLDQAVFGDTPLGWEIAGDEQSVAALTAPALRGFWERWYGPANVVVAAAGDLDHETICAMVAEAFGSDGTHAEDGGWPEGPRFEAAPRLPSPERARVVNRPGSQAHLSIAVPGAAAGRPRAMGARAARHDPRGGDEQPALPAPAGGGRAGVRRALVRHRLRRLRDAGDLRGRRSARAGPRARRDPRRAGRPAGSKRPRRRAGAVPRPTRAGGSSCASRRAGTSPRGWARRRRCTSGR